VLHWLITLVIRVVAHMMCPYASCFRQSPCLSSMASASLFVSLLLFTAVSAVWMCAKICASAAAGTVFLVCILVSVQSMC
jgi:hypothetical protein